MATVIVYGNAGVDFVRVAEGLRDHFDCLGIMPGWRKGNKLKQGWLHWSYDDCKSLRFIGVKVIPYYHFAEGFCKKESR